ncbi:MAG: prepilin-type N-terminal cleavage/methylation domain-containing protein [Candidatus Niyogibacteria bacterium]|nr:MAG: prepilin-type N-terminal cleavage/methylation domain-containing protein [Candidatus Niyogibacteria bacterium]
MKTGFTLLELVVTVGVVLIISLLILADFPEFTRRLELSRTAQAVASSFRQAESAALAVREFSAEVFPAYGLHFENLPAKSYVFFADIDQDYKTSSPDGFYDGPSEEVDTFTINTPVEIYKICGGESGEGADCSITRLDVLYARPNPDIYIITDKGSFLNVEIFVRLTTGAEKKIAIWTTGQLSIE